MSTLKPMAAGDGHAVRRLDRAIAVVAAVELLPVVAFVPVVNA